MGACVRGTCETRASAKSYRCFSLCGDIQQAFAYLLVSLTLDFLRFQGVAPQALAKRIKKDFGYVDKNAYLCRLLIINRLEELNMR